MQHAAAGSKQTTYRLNRLSVRAKWILDVTADLFAGPCVAYKFFELETALCQQAQKFIILLRRHLSRDCILHTDWAVVTTDKVRLGEEARPRSASDRR